MSGTLEVHSHSRLHENREWLRNVEHSHVDGSAGHEHPETGPASYVIDQDDWYAATGMRGGGRKKYTVKPKGPQLDLIALTSEQKTFRVVFVDTGYSPEHVRAGITAEEYEQVRAEFKAAAAVPAESIVGVDRRRQAARLERENAAAGNGGQAVARMVLAVDMTPVYEYIGPEQ